LPESLEGLKERLTQVIAAKLQGERT
jgi:hypothetical protein